MQYLKAEIIRHTVFAALLSALSPVAWLKIGKIIGKCPSYFINTVFSDKDSCNQIIPG